MVSREEEKIRFSLFFLSIWACVRSRRRRRNWRRVSDPSVIDVKRWVEEEKRRRTCENKKYVRVQTHTHTTVARVHYSCFLFIYLFLSHANVCMYKSKFGRPHDYIINLKLVSVVVPLSHPILRRVPSANRSIITWRRRRRRRSRRKKGERERARENWHACTLGIYLFLYREREQRIGDGERETERERERQRNSAADAASASSHHSVWLYLDEKQQ